MRIPHILLHCVTLAITILPMTASAQRQSQGTSFGQILQADATDRAENMGLSECTSIAAPFIPGGAVVSAAVSGLGQMKSRIDTVNQTRYVLYELAENPGPQGMNREEAQAWSLQTEWIKSVERRIASILETACRAQLALTTDANTPARSQERSRATQQTAEPLTAARSTQQMATPEQSFDQELARFQESALQEAENLQIPSAAMQGPNSEIATVSNMMKTRHDTAKNAISNVR